MVCKRIFPPDPFADDDDDLYTHWNTPTLIYSIIYYYVAKHCSPTRHPHAIRGLHFNFEIYVLFPSCTTLR